MYFFFPEKVEQLPVADRDLKMIRLQKAKSCGCVRKCFKRFTPEEIHACRFGMFEFTKEERDLLILTKLEKMEYRTEKPIIRKSVRYNYTFLGQEICEFTFRFLHNRGPKSFKNLKNHYKIHGVSPRIHGNTNKRPPNAYPMETIEKVVIYVKALADAAGEAPDNPMMARNGHKVIVFPGYESKKSIYAKYVEACSLGNERAVGVTLFKSIWHHCLPHIKVANRKILDVNNNAP